MSLQASPPTCQKIFSTTVQAKCSDAVIAVNVYSPQGKLTDCVCLERVYYTVDSVYRLIGFGSFRTAACQACHIGGTRKDTYKFAPPPPPPPVFFCFFFSTRRYWIFFTSLQPNTTAERTFCVFFFRLTTCNPGNNLFYASILRFPRPVAKRSFASLQKYSITK